MKIIESPHEAYAHVDHWRCDGLRIGLVPTMGALHEGHLSLVRRSKQECDLTAVTIFVNPTQFGPNEDFSRYPSAREKDLAALVGLETDLVFVPREQDLYAGGFSTYIEPSPTLEKPLEGVFRPGHFRGVATVVTKLFQILPATIAYFGKKDYQQFAIVRRVVEDLNIPILIEACATVRESDGLAMSSRNRYLSDEQRESALSLWKALKVVEQLVADGVQDVSELERAMQSTLQEFGAERVDYARVVDQQTLETLTVVDRPAVALIAAHVGTTRLIDNMELGHN